MKTLKAKTVWRAFAALVVALVVQGALASTTTYYHNDLAGSPIAATNASGQVIWRESYRPYGERLTKSAASKDNSVWFTSRRQDAETGLVYMGARFYDPVIGRFISTDPKRFDAASLHSFNRYAYANNNPNKYRDPDGQDAVIINRKDGGVNIQIPISFSGSGASSAAIAMIKDDIASRWSGTYEIDGKDTSISVQVVDGSAYGIVNEISLTSGPTSNILQGASFVRGGNSGEWDVSSPGMKSGEAAHEAGHLMGLADKYGEGGLDAGGRRMTIPRHGYENDLMGASGGRTAASHMGAILSASGNKVINE